MGRKRAPPRVRANRLNAKKSTGPKTIAGKKRSARNALLHGLSAKAREFSSHPDMDRFVELLCAGDQRQQVIEAASEVAEAQFELNTIRQYSLILQILKAKRRSVPLPESELLDDPIISEFMDYMSTGEPAGFGVPEKADHRLHNRVLNFIFKQARRSKDPETERFKLDRYERMGWQRRLVAMEKLDQLQTEFFTESILPSSRNVSQPKVRLMGLSGSLASPCNSKT